MGDFTIGALLGANQSFETWGSTAPQSWSVVSNQASFFQVGSATAVHSSDWGLQARVDSTAGTRQALRWAYGAALDGHRAWFPDVTTHDLRVRAWGRALDAPSSGQLRLRLYGNAEVLGDPIAHAAALARLELQTTVHSAGDYPDLALDRTAAANSQATVLLDDVQAEVDWMTLLPEWGAAQGEQRQRSLHRGGDGTLALHDWAAWRRLVVPLRYITRAQAGRLSWWWQQGLPLAVTLSSSDPASTLNMRLVNGRTPSGRRMGPYSDLFEATLELESLDPGTLIY